MKKLFPSTQFKKDYKRVKKQPQKIDALKEVLTLLQEEKPIPAEYLPHMLHGNYKTC